MAPVSARCIALFAGGSGSLFSKINGSTFGKGIRVAGVGCTCAIASKPLRHGEHRCFITTRRQEELRTYSLLLDKGARDRYAEDQITSQLFTQSLADTFGVQVRGSLFNLTEKDALHSEVKTFTEEQQLAQLLDGEIPMVVFPSERGSCSGRRIVLPGSFNPLHEGHLQLMEAACGLVRDSVPCFEISAINADKPPLQVADIMKRVEQFKERVLCGVLSCYEWHWDFLCQCPSGISGTDGARGTSVGSGTSAASDSMGLVGSVCPSEISGTSGGQSSGTSGASGTMGLVRPVGPVGM
ncbi:hypothetical protein CBR_g39317 [Chara braunii]|uniref:Cytidyltransferase-like domain-containing protein n=1 Tax=Chara braunii TaxID=69332 RepID=A0A388K1D6_CHABU|nr:hypothetical protein CBR_g39317 [Chara braunii]|eukprot:GBG63773.1 hypothetical protein CBR_g39317 [Chara braunii]